MTMALSAKIDGGGVCGMAPMRTGMAAGMDVDPMSATGARRDWSGGGLPPQEVMDAAARTSARS
jgi:hypothetical protein